MTTDANRTSSLVVATNPLTPGCPEFHTMESFGLVPSDGGSRSKEVMTFDHLSSLGSHPIAKSQQLLASLLKKSPTALKEWLRRVINLHTASDVTGHIQASVYTYFANGGYWLDATIRVNTKKTQLDVSWDSTKVQATGDNLTSLSQLTPEQKHALGNICHASSSRKCLSLLARVGRNQLGADARIKQRFVVSTAPFGSRNRPVSTDGAPDPFVDDEFPEDEGGVRTGKVSSEIRPFLEATKKISEAVMDGIVQNCVLFLKYVLEVRKERETFEGGKSGGKSEEEAWRNKDVSNPKEKKKTTRFLSDNGVSAGMQYLQSNWAKRRDADFIDGLEKSVRDAIEAEYEDEPPSYVYYPLLRDPTAPPGTNEFLPGTSSPGRPHIAFTHEMARALKSDKSDMFKLIPPDTTKPSFMTSEWCRKLRDIMSAMPERKDSSLPASMYQRANVKILREYGFEFKNVPTYILTIQMRRVEGVPNEVPFPKLVEIEPGVNASIPVGSLVLIDYNYHTFSLKEAPKKVRTELNVQRVIFIGTTESLGMEPLADEFVHQDDTEYKADALDDMLAKTGLTLDELKAFASDPMVISEEHHNEVPPLEDGPRGTVTADPGPGVDTPPAMSDEHIEYNPVEPPEEPSSELGRHPRQHEEEQVRKPKKSKHNKVVE